MAEHQRRCEPKLTRDNYNPKDSYDSAFVRPESRQRERQNRIDHQHSGEISDDGDQGVHWSWLSLKVQRLILFLLAG